MNKKKIGFDKLVEIIGKDYFDEHKDSAVFSSEETDKGLFCFLGIDLHADERTVTLSCSVDEWDIYASCYVLEDGEVVIDKCRLLRQTKKIDLDQFVMPTTERGRNADEYIREMRDNDRL